MSRTVSNTGGAGESTTNHETIRRWARRRDAKPARDEADAEGALRFSFAEGDRFSRVSWSTFFETFEREGLAFVYQPASDGEESPDHFYKFVDRATV